MGDTRPKTDRLNAHAVIPKDGRQW